MPVATALVTPVTVPMLTLTAATTVAMVDVDNGDSHNSLDSRLRPFVILILTTSLSLAVLAGVWIERYMGQSRSTMVVAVC